MYVYKKALIVMAALGIVTFPGCEGGNGAHISGKFSILGQSGEFSIDTRPVVPVAPKPSNQRGFPIRVELAGDSAFLSFNQNSGIDGLYQTDVDGEGNMWRPFAKDHVAYHSMQRTMGEPQAVAVNGETFLLAPRLEGALPALVGTAEDLATAHNITGAAPGSIVQQGRLYGTFFGGELESNWQVSVPYPSTAGVPNALLYDLQVQTGVVESQVGGPAFAMLAIKGPLKEVARFLADAGFESVRFRIPGSFERYLAVVNTQSRTVTVSTEGSTVYSVTYN